MTEIDWHSDLGSYCAALRAGEDSVPLLRSGIAERDARWAEVLTSLYGPGSIASRPPCHIVSIGEAAGPVAEALSARYGSRHARLFDVDGLGDALRDAREVYCMIVSMASDLCASRVVKALQAARRAGLSIGFVAGRDPAGLGFSVAKTLLNPVDTDSALGVFDAVSHHLDHDAADSAEIDRALRKPQDVKVIRSHGEGAHAKLPGLTVCGLLDDTEFSEAPDVGCSRTRDACKRAPPGKWRGVLFASEIVSPTVVFVCCNGFSFAQDHYPSPVSISLALTEGWAGSVIAPVRALVAPDSLMDLVYDMIGRGVRTGDAVVCLNEHCLEAGQGMTFALHGDPRQVFGNATRAFDPPAAIADGARKLSRADGDHHRYWVATFLRGLRRGQRYLEALCVCIGPDMVEAIRMLQMELSGLLATTIEVARFADAACTQEELARLRQDVSLLNLKARALDAKAVGAILETRSSADPYDLGHYDQFTRDSADGPDCRRCGTALDLHYFGDSPTAEDARVGELCCVCGPYREYRAKGIRIEPTLMADGSDDTRCLVIAVRVLRDGPSPAPFPFASVALRFFDKGRDRCIASLSQNVALNDDAVAFRIDLPHDLSPDLHSIRMLASCGLDLCYARLRFAGGLPAAKPAHPAGLRGPT